MRKYFSVVKHLVLGAIVIIIAIIVIEAIAIAHHSMGDFMVDRLNTASGVE